MKLLRILLACVLLMSAAPASAATGTIMPTPYQTVFDSNGDPISGACIWTYTAGTTTPVATYTDVNLSVANSNPIVADSAGRFGAFLTQGVSYKFVYETACTAPSHGTTIRTVDNIATVPGVAGGIDVTGTAGETFTAGLCAYLSDGSGGKTQGSWYKCDTSNPYSNTLPLIAMVPSAITSGNTGSFRIAGQITGLSSLTVGADYYVSTSGAITATPPNGRRFVGRADSATTLIVNGNPAPAPVPVVDDFRIWPSSATCIPSADVTAATTLYLTPCNGNRITLSDASGNLAVYTSAEISIAVPSTTSQMYDVWVYANNGVPTLELLAWTNDTTRATGIAKTTVGFYTKSGDLTRRYVGSMRTTTVSGQTESSKAKRYVWNLYNQLMLELSKGETAASWTTASVTPVQANASTANQVDVVVGQATTIWVSLMAQGETNGGAGAQVFVGIGAGSATAATRQLEITSAAATYQLSFNVSHVTTQAAGRQFYTWLNWVGSNTGTFYGTTLNGTTGLMGWVLG